MSYFRMPLGFHFNSLIGKIVLKQTHLHKETLHSALHRQEEIGLLPRNVFLAVAVTSGLVGPAQAPLLEI